MELIRFTTSDQFPGGCGKRVRNTQCAIVQESGALREIATRLGESSYCGDSTRRVKLLRNREPVLSDLSVVRSRKCYWLNMLCFGRFGYDPNRTLKRFCR